MSDESEEENAENELEEGNCDKNEVEVDVGVKNEKRSEIISENELSLRAQSVSEIDGGDESDGSVQIIDPPVVPLLVPISSQLQLQCKSESDIVNTTKVNESADMHGNQSNNPIVIDDDTEMAEQKEECEAPTAGEKSSEIDKEKQMPEPSASIEKNVDLVMDTEICIDPKETDSKIADDEITDDKATNDVNSNAQSDDSSNAKLANQENVIPIDSHHNQPLRRS